MSDSASGDETRLDLGRDRLQSAFIEIPGYGVVINRDDMAGMNGRAEAAPGSPSDPLSLD